METKNTFYRYLHVYPASNERWYNIPLHIAVALLFACGILDGAHRIFINQTTAGIVEIVIFGLMLLALPLVYPALAWAAYIIGNVLIGIGRGFAEGILDAYHVVKGDLLIDNPEEEHFLKKLNRIEKPGELRKETVREVPYAAPIEVPGETIYVKEEVEKIVEKIVIQEKNTVTEIFRPIPKTDDEEEKIRYGIRIYIWKTLQEFLTPIEMQTLHEAMIAVKDNEPSRIVAVTSASDLTMIKARSMRMSKNDLYSLADNLCRMMKLDANKSFEIFSTLFPNIYGKTNPVTFVKSMPKDNRYDKDGKPLANKFVVHLAKQTRDNIDAYLLDLYEESQKSEVMVS